MKLNQLSLLGENVFPFIDKGDGLTSESERVCMLLSLVAHVDGYRMMVGATTLLDVRYTWDIVLSSSGMVDVDTCHTVDT